MEFLSHLDRQGNEEADRLARAAVLAHRVPQHIRVMVEKQECEVRHMA